MSLTFLKNWFAKQNDSEKQPAINLFATNFNIEHTKGKKREANFIIPFTYQRLDLLVRQLTFINRCSSNVIDSIVIEGSERIVFGYIQDGVFIKDERKNKYFRKKVKQAHNDWVEVILNMKE